MSIAHSIRQNTRQNEGSVAAVEPLGDGVVRICAAARLPILQWRPGQAVAVTAGGIAQHSTRVHPRTYSSVTV